MSKSVLVIHSSPMGEHSISRKVTGKIVEKIKTETPDATIVERDLAVSNIPHVSAMQIGATYQPDMFSEEQRNEALGLADELIDEVMQADIVVIGAPMWNFSIPSSLKAWIDHIVRVGVTFAYTETGPKGLLPEGKIVFVAVSRGGVYSSGPAQSMDVQEPYLNVVLPFIGLNDISYIRAEGVGMGEEAVATAMATAEAAIASAV